jgi:hypothetical protein
MIFLLWGVPNLAIVISAKKSIMKNAGTFLGNILMKNGLKNIINCGIIRDSIDSAIIF